MIRRKRINILIVDDADYSIQLTCDCLHEVLSDLGFNAKFYKATNGLEAVEKYRELNEKIDFVIMDMIMPKMNGYEALLEIRKLDDSIPSKVAVLSAHVITKNIKDAINEHLITEENNFPKPCDFEKLASYIKETVSATSK